MNQLDLRDRVAVITGGARGIGHAAAARALGSGASVVIWDIDAARAESRGTGPGRARDDQRGRSSS